MSRQVIVELSPSPPAVASSQRLISLDAMRGLTVALMILVNNAGDGRVSYAQLRHSAWNGCTLTDLVFPSFLFIVGGSLVLAGRAHCARGLSRGSFLRRAARRAVLLFAIGLTLNALPAFQIGDVRYFGVLQRIALCYLAATAICLAGGVWASLLVCVSAITGYWLLMTRVPMPEFGLPGVSVPLLDQTGNLAALLDRMLVPPAHLYHRGVYDPEGLLSTLPAISTTLLGVLAVSWLVSRNTPAAKAGTLLAAAVLLTVGGLAWSHSFPLNKRLWTSSFVLLTGGISAGLLASLFWLLDGPFPLRRGVGPSIALGRNALTAYLFSEVLAIALAAIPMSGGRNLQQVLFGLLPTWLGPPPMVSLLYSVLFVVVCGFVVLGLSRRGLSLKL